jgi:hypothetical protein
MVYKIMKHRVTCEMNYLRDNLVLEATEKKYGDFSNSGKDGFTRPNLVAEDSEIFCWWKDTIIVSIKFVGREKTWTHEGMSFLIDKNVFSSINPEMAR